MVASDTHRGQPFSFRSERAALDFAATLMFRTGAPLELLDTASELSSWIVAAGLLDVAPRVTPRQLREAIALREAIYRAALARIAGQSLAPADVAVMNRLARPAPVAPSLRGDGTTARTGDATHALSSLARDAIAVLGGAERAPLRQCRRDGCTRLFLDRTRAGTRVWCGMRECGNRVNAAAYRRRRV
jgi:predicted RNA-binding Zn ribbon-like protein